MFPFADPQFQLDLYRQHSEELRREAAEYRLAREIRRRSRAAHRRGRPARSPVE